MPKQAISEEYRASSDALSAYIKEIHAEANLLTREAESELAQSIHDGRKNVVKEILATPEGAENLQYFYSTIVQSNVPKETDHESDDDEDIGKFRSPEEIEHAAGLVSKLDVHLKNLERQAGKKPLRSTITALEEKKDQLADLILGTFRPADKDLDEVAALKPSSALRQAQRERNAAKDKMVKSNLRLVISVAKKYRRTSVPLIDRVQDGNLGLIKGIEVFDHTLGNRISTYVTWWIRHYISRGADNTGRTIRHPVHALEKFKKIKEAERSMFNQTGVDPTDEDVAAKLKMKPEEVAKFRYLTIGEPLSLDAPVGEKDSISFGDMLASDKSPPDAGIEEKQRAELARRVLEKLDGIDKRVILKRFGFDNKGEGYTFQEIGDVYELSRERIRQIESRGKEKLRIIAKHEPASAELFPTGPTKPTTSHAPKRPAPEAKIA
ncbi:MAG: sigma-70 family RNA polymerase sigma factor [Alphaproteobacteria bacterium]